MQLKVFISNRSSSFADDDVELTVKSEHDILGVGFAAARAVRAWLKSIPLVPSTSDLHFNIYAEMVGDESSPAAADAEGKAPRPKRKKKASK